jgi:hypothetical protein
MLNYWCEGPVRNTRVTSRIEFRPHCRVTSSVLVVTTLTAWFKNDQRLIVYETSVFLSTKSAVMGDDGE